jgi:hypothetical protein
MDSFYWIFCWHIQFKTERYWYQLVGFRKVTAGIN